jgi:ABC-type branched-subunit amino acid transport system substrate-binding protein
MQSMGRRASGVGDYGAGLSRRAFLASALASEFAMLTGFARGQDSQPLKIGMVRPLTGRFASAFAPLFVGARIAVDEINGSGGVLGRRIEIIDEDDEGSPAKEPDVMKKLIDAGAQFVIGPVGTSQALSALPVATQAKLIVGSGAFGYEAQDAAKYPYQFQFIYNNFVQAAATVEFMVDKRGFKKIGVIQETTGWGQGYGQGLVNELKKRGLAPAAFETFALSATDLKPYVRNIQKSGADALIIGTSIPTVSALVFDAIKTVQYFPALMVGANGLMSDALIDILPANVLENIYAAYLRAFSYTDAEPPGERQVAYVKKILSYPESKGQEPNAATSPFYDFLHVLKHVAEDQKSFDPDKLKQGFEQVRDYPGMFGKLSLSADNHCAVPADALAFVKLKSARDPRAMGCFRERAGT